MHHDSPYPRRHISRHAEDSARAAVLRVLFLLAVALCLAAYAFFPYPSLGAARSGDDSSALRARSVTPLDEPLAALSADEQCRAVHHAEDQCAFIHQYCPQDEGGFSAYLDLYYCRLSHAKPVAAAALITWLVVLFTTIGITASEYFCIDLNTFAGVLGMGENLTGVTLLAFGNGSPDVFSTFAAMNTDSGSLAVGELFGAAGFIAAVVTGSMALVRPFHVARKSFVRDILFFTGAAAFSMVFLWDGKLHFWECIAMVIYYVFYVACVMVWHWWLSRRRQRKEREAAARAHFLPPEDETVLENDAYHDDPEEATPHPRPSRAVSQEDWSALEQGGNPYEDDRYEDDEEEARDRWMGELTSNMRVTRPTGRSRRNTAAIRPSLAGALEFQAVLKSLQRSRNIQTIPMHSRRFSDDPNYTTLQQQDQMSANFDPASRPMYAVNGTNERSPLLLQRDGEHTAPFPVGATRRGRAVSTNDMASFHSSAPFPSLSPVVSEDYLIAPPNEDRRSTGHPTLNVPHTNSPAVMIEPATPLRETPLQRQGATVTMSTTDLLAPPDAVPLARSTSEYFTRSPSLHSTHSSQDSPRAVPRASELPRITMPTPERSPASSRSTSPFPPYRDMPSPARTSGTRSPISTGPPSLYLPEPLASPESTPTEPAAMEGIPRRPTRLERIWPRSILPPLGDIISILFPTFYTWREKNWWTRILGLVAAPSVFLLTLTLPVVVPEEANDSQTSSPTKKLSGDTVRSKSNVTIPTIVSEHWLDPQDPTTHEGATGIGNVPTAAAQAEQHHQHASISAEPQAIPNSLVSEVAYHPRPADWNRWLTAIQLFTAPIFVVVAVWSQMPPETSPSWLIRPVLICLLISLILLIPFLLTTSSTHRPPVYLLILSSVGFIVSIAWISAVASQVVGALKALAVILNMSHAIMGLTIFAVGNSLGDLVADITVARVGFPVMALSACFAGPMLNILLGIGLSGSYRLLMGEERRRRKHPDKGVRFKAYHIQVSQTLIVSGITLLLTLVFLLFAVPLNRWVLDRKIGLALIAIWAISTVFNIIVEVTGFLDGAEAFLHGI